MSVDVGSSGIKAAAFDLRGNPLDVEVQNCDYLPAAPGFYELDPDETWRRTTEAVRRLLRRVPLRGVAAVGVSAQLGLVAVDRSGKPLRPAITWMDHRAAAEAKLIRQRLGEAALYRVTGRRATGELLAAKVLWIKQYEPAVYDRTVRFDSLKDYLVTRLGGQPGTDPAHASYTLLYDVVRGIWDEGILQELGIDLSRLPQVLPAETIVGQVSKEAAELTGLVAGTPIVLGGPDGTVGGLGAGLIGVGASVNVVGTTDVVFTCLERPVLDPDHRVVLNRHVVPGRWLIGGPMSITGGFLKWFAKQFLKEDADRAAAEGELPYPFLDRQAACLEPGSGGLVCVPSMAGERAPLWDPNVRGVLLGLSPEHTKAHVYRAALEGSAFALRRMLEALADAGVEVADLRVTGGGSKSSLWRQIRADVTGRRVLLPAVHQATMLGSSILAAVGVGFFDGWDAAVRAMVDVAESTVPDPENTARYAPYYSIFEDLYPRLRQVFSDLADLPSETDRRG